MVLEGLQVAQDRVGHPVAVAVAADDLRVDRSEFGGVAHDDQVRAERDQRPGALGEVQDDDPQGGGADFLPDHQDELLRGVDVSAAGVEQEVEVLAARDVVEQVDQPDGVVAVDHGAQAGDVADQVPSGFPADRLDQALPLVAVSVDRLVHRGPGWAGHRARRVRARLRIRILGHPRASVCLAPTSLFPRGCSSGTGTRAGLSRCWA